MNKIDEIIEKIETLNGFQEVLDLVKKNSVGKVWLIGGSVYRVVASVWHGSEVKVVDFDFVVEEVASEVVVPEGWEVEINSFGNPKFIKGVLEIDLIPINTIKPIVDRELEPTIENVLVTTTLGIQSIVYNIETKEILGDIGLEDLKNRVVRVNDREAYPEYKVPLKDLIKNKAQELGFTADFS